MEQKIIAALALAACVAFLLTGCGKLNLDFGEKLGSTASEAMDETGKSGKLGDLLLDEDETTATSGTEGVTQPSPETSEPTAATEATAASDSKTQSEGDSTEPQAENPTQAATEEQASNPTSGYTSSGTITLPFVPVE